MSAYAALVSFQETLRTIIDCGGLRILGCRAQLRSFNGDVTCLLDFLDNYSGGQITDLETKMREAAYEAEDLIESAITIRFRSLVVTTFYNFIRAVVVFLSVSRGDWIQRFMALLLASICMILDAVVRLALDGRNCLEAGEFYRVSHYFGVIKKDVNQIKEGRGEQTGQAELILLRRTLDSVIGSVGLISDSCRDQLKSLRDQDLDAQIGDAASKAKALIESEISGPNSTWRKFCDLIKAPWLASWFNLPASAVLTTIMLTFINYKLPFAPSPHATLLTQSVTRRFSTLALGIGVHVLGTGGGEAVFLAMNRSKSEDKQLREVIDILGKIMSQPIHASGSPRELPEARDSEGRNVVVGLENDILCIKARLLQDSRRLEVTSIVGMGGIGKTTLARQVYDDPGIADHFDIRAWVAISESSLLHVLQRLLHSINIPAVQKPNYDVDEEKLGEHLHKVLSSRRFLIVMDDLWGIEVWDFVRKYFPDNSNGSRILLTSRWSPATSHHESGRFRHEMQCLGENDSWDLLKKKVFGGETCPNDLESTGRAIALGCRGLPLAIVVIGRVLSKDNRRETWREVEEKLRNSELMQFREQCLEILGWSYNHLPHHLRPCFLYMGVFPEDSREIPVSRLISLWAAEGFLQPCSEEVAENYLKELVDRDMISVCKLSCSGKITRCSIHDLWREFCAQTARRQNFFHVVDCAYLARERPNQTPRRLSIRTDVQQVDLSSRCLRSFLCSTNLPNYQSSGFLDFPKLRVLDVLELHLEAFPAQITQLVSLRYLALTCDDSLPPSLSKLGYLETIVHHHSSPDNKYLHLPRAIWSMPNLRHLCVKPGYCLSDPLGYRLPWNTACLQHLQTLMGITNFRWNKGIVKRIPNVKKLGVAYDVCFVDWPENELDSLANLLQLESLKITVEYEGHPPMFFVQPLRLAFPQTLKKLSLSGCRIPWECMTTVGKLPKLQVLKLREFACEGQIWKPVEGGFCQLMFLLLEDSDLKEWTSDETHFPRLRRLTLRRCHKLKEVPSGMGEIPTLKRMELVNCHPAAVASAKQILEEQQQMGNEDLNIHIEGSSAKGRSRRRKPKSTIHKTKRRFF